MLVFTMLYVERWSMHEHECWCIRKHIAC